MSTVNEITPEDLVITKEGKNVMSGGYKIDNLFLENNISPLSTDNSNNQEGGNISSMFSNLAVPAGLLLLQQKVNKHTFSNMYNKDTSQVVDSSLYDKLLGIASGKKESKPTKEKKVKSERKRKTRGKKSSSNKKTKKRR
tara:strand:- start:85 stop:504 length:420 start_codon:yes stop_codon:yes gene_type:complete